MSVHTATGPARSSTPGKNVDRSRTRWAILFAVPIFQTAAAKSAAKTT